MYGSWDVGGEERIAEGGRGRGSSGEVSEPGTDDPEGLLFYDEGEEVAGDVGNYRDEEGEEAEEEQEEEVVEVGVRGDGVGAQDEEGAALSSSSSSSASSAAELRSALSFDTPEIFVYEVVYPGGVYVRVSPDLSSPKSGLVLPVGTRVEADKSLVMDGVTYVKLMGPVEAGGGGWIFERKGNTQILHLVEHLRLDTVGSIGGADSRVVTPSDTSPRGYTMRTPTPGATDGYANCSGGGGTGGDGSLTHSESYCAGMNAAAAGSGGDFGGGHSGSMGNLSGYAEATSTTTTPPPDARRRPSAGNVRETPAVVRNFLDHRKSARVRRRPLAETKIWQRFRDEARHVQSLHDFIRLIRQWTASADGRHVVELPDSSSTALSRATLERIRLVDNLASIVITCGIDVDSACLRECLWVLCNMGTSSCERLVETFSTEAAHRLATFGEHDVQIVAASFTTIGHRVERTFAGQHVGVKPECIREMLQDWIVLQLELGQHGAGREQTEQRLEQQRQQKLMQQEAIRQTAQAREAAEARKRGANQTWSVWSLFKAGEEQLEELRNPSLQLAWTFA